MRSDATLTVSGSRVGSIPTGSTAARAGLYRAGQGRYRPDIDGLRAIAVLAVLLYHAFPEAAPRGFLGVDVFFVISGFLITGIILRESAEARFNLARFYAHRIRRILPALVVVIAASFCIGWWVMLPLEFSELGQQMLGGALFVSNLQFWRETGYFDTQAALKPFLHLWSLAVEEQFYLLWPLLLMALSGRRRRVLALAVGLAFASFASQAALGVAHPAAAFYLPFARFWELMLGAALAAWPMHQEAPRRGMVLALAGLALLLAGLSLPLIGGEASPWPRLLPTIGTLLLIGAGPGNKLGRALLGWRGLVAIGRISYPLYLWHWPLLAFARVTVGPDLTAASRAGLMAASFVLAWLTYVAVERPIRFGRLRARAVPGLCAALAVLGCLGLVTDLSTGFPLRVPPAIRIYTEVKYDWSQGARVGQCWLYMIDPADGFAPECLPDHQEGRRTVLLWGDSHAARLYNGLVALAGPDTEVAQLTRNSCPPVIDFTYPICIASNEYVLARIARQRPDMVILFAVWNAYESHVAGSAMASRLAETLRRLQEIGVPRVLVIGPAPQWDEDLPLALAHIWRRNLTGGELPARMRFESREAPFAVDHDMRPIVAGLNVPYVSLIDMLCNAQGCLTRANDGPDGLITTDYGHLTTAGATFVARQLPIGQAGDPP